MTEEEVDELEDRALTLDEIEIIEKTVLSLNNGCKCVPPYIVEKISNTEYRVSVLSGDKSAFL